MLMTMTTTTTITTTTMMTTIAFDFCLSGQFFAKITPSPSPQNVNF